MWLQTFVISTRRRNLTSRMKPFQSSYEEIASVSSPPPDKRPDGQLASVLAFGTTGFRNTASTFFSYLLSLPAVPSFAGSYCFTAENDARRCLSSNAIGMFEHEMSTRDRSFLVGNRTPENFHLGMSFSRWHSSRPPFP
ncbi:hypothetical protein CEXT_230531 [Caerostris extrusa]|uniref:Uncharacterized protein n=1 Tax=Caerostris extrusa TaxID=172846 RepID=A0AAV4U9M7_CAEEX|nr:hypothetical protein CEXT_230531 [Caerostris extrusa]